MHKIVYEVTQRIIERSQVSRGIYLSRIDEAKNALQGCKRLSCSNMAHAMAPLTHDDKARLNDANTPNIAIVSAYNDMLSAHEPYKQYPPLLKRALAHLGATAQVAGGVPAMCDGVTQSQPGMELSLFSRDNIAMGTAIALSHNVYDGALYLGVCDKIVPGLLIGALSFGHLPGIFVPAGPMPSGISNAKKAKIRQEFAQGKVSENSLLEAEIASYHSSGTCTFYGTANSNQMLLEMMGLQLPNSSFVNTDTPLRDALTQHAAKTLMQMTRQSGTFTCIADIIDERSFVNAIIGLMATGGSSNHTIHLIAMARAAGIVLNWDDFDALSKVTPLLCRMYPNGEADVNHFREAGGMSVVIAQLSDAGLIHSDVNTVMGKGLERFILQPRYENQTLFFDAGARESLNSAVIASHATPFQHEGGLKLLQSTLGRSVIKTSALHHEHLCIEAPAMVFESQEALQRAFQHNELEKDFIAIVRYQGPKANGMPELHGLMPPLGALQDRGFKVAIITDGRMSGASGKIPSAIHLSPEALENPLLARLENGDMLRFDVEHGIITLLEDEADVMARTPAQPQLSTHHYGFGRELFSAVRQSVGSAEEGASLFDLSGKERA
jgi:phosphogluconate dehydratase